MPSAPCAAAWRCSSSAGRSAPKCRPRHGHAGFDVRVGIHTGGVLLGGGVDADGTIRGIAVNIAARMEQTAPAGALRISHDTYAQVRGIFDVEPQEPLAVKGVDAPIQSYLVLRAKPRSFRIATRGIEGVATRMIGRDAELEALQDAFKRLFAERRLAAVTVVADAGIGKSRLLYEFEAWTEARPERFFLFRGRATPQTQAPALSACCATSWPGASRSPTTTASRPRRPKIEQGIVPLFLHDDGADLAEGHAHLLGHLIGIDYRDSRHITRHPRRPQADPQPRLPRRGAGVPPGQRRRRLARRAAARRPALGRRRQPGLPQLPGEVNRDVPLLILAFTRPTLFERRADWKALARHHQRIDLAPLDKTRAASWPTSC